MNTEVKTYYIPQNPNIIKGHIYTMYINNNTNMDLSSILNFNTNLITPYTQGNFIEITEKDYTRLLELNTISYQLTNKRTQDIQNFLQEETMTMNELSKINTERETLIKKLSKEKEKTK